MPKVWSSNPFLRQLQDQIVCWLSSGVMNPLIVRVSHCSRGNSRQALARSLEPNRRRGIAEFRYVNRVLVVVPSDKVLMVACLRLPGRVYSSPGHLVYLATSVCDISLTPAMCSAMRARRVLPGEMVLTSI